MSRTVLIDLNAKQLSIILESPSWKGDPVSSPLTVPVLPANALSDATIPELLLVTSTNAFLEAFSTNF